MVKIVSPGSYDFGAPTSRLVKVAAGGLRGNDLRDFIKVASHEFVDVLRDWKPESGEVPVHFIAIGATESFGSNRNGDGFRRGPCCEQHHTFVKHAKFYRDHKNRDPNKSYGYIKASAFNADMDRIEVLVSLYGTKEAAERHNALVADKEMAKLAGDEEISCSMASLVPFDRCNSCDNKARTRAEYCTSVDEGGHCKHGGLKHNISRLCDDGLQLHADNPVNRWFDLSHVFRPADRIAFALGKAAESELVVAAPVMKLEEVPARILHGAGLISGTLQKQSEWIAASPTRLEPDELLSPISAEPVVCPPHIKLSHALRALADEHIVLPMPEFLRLIKAAERDKDLIKLSACAAAAAIDTEALAVEVLSTSAVYQPRSEPASPAVRQWAHKLAESYGRDLRWVARRAQRRGLRSAEDSTADYLELFNKSAEYAKHSELGQELASHYRRYRAAAEISANRACVAEGPG